MNAKIISIACLVLPILFVIGCKKSDNPVDASIPDQTNGRITIINDEAKLAMRLKTKNEPVLMDAPGLPKTTSRSAFSLTLIAELTPPVVSGQTLQATSVSLNGNFAYISYTMVGSPYVGAIDVVQVKAGFNATVKSEATFTDTDVSSVCFDAVNNKAYLAEATGDLSFSSPAVLEMITSNGGKLELVGSVRKSLSSFVATAIAVDNGTVYATTGNTGGLYKVTQDTSIQKFTALADARWVDFDANNVIVLQGTPGRIAVIDKSTDAITNTFTFQGANVAESKSTVRLLGGKALIAAGDGGVKLMNIATGTIVGSIPRTIVSGLDSSLSVTNAVDGAGVYVYISNGEAGVYVAQASQALENASGDAAVTLTVLGKLRFSNLQSVNHVAFDGSTLIVASGLGGVKIVDVSF